MKRFPILSSFSNLVLRSMQSKGLGLLFHSIADVGTWQPSLGPRTTLPKDVFERIIQRVALEYHPISIGECVKGLQKGRLPSRSCVITFDDGFRDNMEVALPVLEAYDVPAVIYVTTGFVDGTVAPFEFQLGFLMEKAEQIEFVWQGMRNRYELHSAAQKRRCYNEIRKLLRVEDAPTRRRKIDELADQVGIGAEYRGPKFLDWHDVRRVADSRLITLGCHGHDHIFLRSPAIDEPGVLEDIRNAKEILEDYVSQSVVHFSYPYGANSPKVRAVLAAHGFESAVTTCRQLILSRQTDVYSIPRIEITSENWQSVLS